MRSILRVLSPDHKGETERGLEGQDTYKKTKNYVSVVPLNPKEVISMGWSGSQSWRFWVVYG